MPRIESYRFGQIVVDGRRYTSDLIIFPDRVQPDWWREEGHSLSQADIWEVFADPPEVLVIGLGAMGCMRVPEETLAALQKAGIEVMALPTQRACEAYNELAGSKKVVAALHLTC
mgnify:CR=1 FL=1